MIPNNKKPLDVAITTYNEFKNTTVMKQFDMKMEELRNSGELEKDMKKRREENNLRELNSKKVARQSVAHIRKWKTTTEKIHMEELAIFSKLNITKFLTIYDRNEIDFFMEDVKDLIQEGKDIVENSRIKRKRARRSISKIKNNHRVIHCIFNVFMNMIF